MEDIQSFNIHAASYADVLHILPGENIIGFEVWPVALNRDEEGGTDSEPLSPEEIAAGRKPDVYGVYARIGTLDYNLAQILADCADEQSAYELVFILQLVVAHCGGKLGWLLRPTPGTAPIPIPAAEPEPPSIIGWAFDRYGNPVPIHAPVNDKLQPVYPSGQTMVGQIVSGVGGAENKWDYNEQAGGIARPSYLVNKGRAWAATAVKVRIEQVIEVTQVIVH